jgi:two-component system sensor histidine kinase/response regulator
VGVSAGPFERRYSKQNNRVEQPLSEVMSTDTRSADRSRLRLLVAEDNSVNQKVAVAMLEKLGYEAEVAVNGVEAVERVGGKDFAAVLMDCQMPEMDGYEATAAIRRLEVMKNSSRIPIIAMTAAAMEGDREKCIAAGMDDYISKPVRLPELYAVLQRWTASSRPSPAAEESPKAEVSDEVAAHIDPVRISELRELTDKANRDGFSVLADSFLEDAPPRLVAIEQAFAGTDTATIAWEAHALKGAAANLGANKLSAQCQRMELKAKASDVPGAEAVFAELQTEFQKVKDSLAAVLMSEHVDREEETIHL